MRHCRELHINRRFLSYTENEVITMLKRAREMGINLDDKGDMTLQELDRLVNIVREEKE